MPARNVLKEWILQASCKANRHNKASPYENCFRFFTGNDNSPILCPAPSWYQTGILLVHIHWSNDQWLLNMEPPACSPMATLLMGLVPRQLQDKPQQLTDHNEITILGKKFLFRSAQWLHLRELMQRKQQDTWAGMLQEGGKVGAAALSQTFKLMMKSPDHHVWSCLQNHRQSCARSLVKMCTHRTSASRHSVHHMHKEYFTTQELKQQQRLCATPWQQRIGHHRYVKLPGDATESNPRN